MQVIIKNRINGAGDELIGDVNLKAPELIVALWEAPQSKMHRFFAKPTQKPTTDHVQEVMNSSILSFERIRFTPYYGTAISGVTLISNNRYWTGLEIDEKEYFKYHTKQIGLVDRLVTANSRPYPSPILIPLPEPRPVDEVNPIYPNKAPLKIEPKKETAPNTHKNKVDGPNLMIHAILGIVVTAACMALGIIWPLSLVIVILSSCAVFFARERFGIQAPTPKPQKTANTEVPKPNLESRSPDKPIPTLPVPDNISLLFSQNTLQEPARPVKDAPPNPTKMAKI
jgi:hypothetical protein